VANWVLSPISAKNMVIKVELNTVQKLQEGGLSGFFSVKAIDLLSLIG
jgi:hypothetical protein